MQVVGRTAIFLDSADSCSVEGMASPDSSYYDLYLFLAKLCTNLIDILRRVVRLVRFTFREVFMNVIGKETKRSFPLDFSCGQGSVIDDSAS